MLIYTQSCQTWDELIKVDRPMRLIRSKKTIDKNGPLRLNF